MKRKYQLQKQRNNSKIFFPKEDNKIKGRSHSNFIIKKKMIENSEDFCDIIEGEDEFECKKIEMKNSNPKISLKNEKKFSFTKSKKLIRKKSEKDLKEMYLLAGTAQNEEKLFSYNDVLLLTHKNSYSNGIGGDTTITNNNLSENNFNEIFEKISKKKI